MLSFLKGHSNVNLQNYYYGILSEVVKVKFSVSGLCLHSCPLNIFTTVLMNGNSTTSRVSVQIFSFVTMNVIYLHCQVQICVKIGSDTCVPVGAF